MGRPDNRDRDRRSARRPPPARERRRPYMLSDVLELLTSIEQHRTAVEEGWATFNAWRADSDELNEEWEKFAAAGGVTASEFRDFTKGQFRSRAIRSKRHLRLIANSDRARRRPPPPMRPDNAA